MKHAEKNEFDLLLRGLAKRDRASGESPDLKQPATEHLDADELNSYAEDVLPSAARARYTEHLADCASCRKIVTQLTLSAGSLAHSDVSEKVSGSSFWQRLATLFSPGVLRYAGPAFAVLAVVAISFLVLRQQQQKGSDFIAQNEPAVATEPAASPEGEQLKGALDHADQPQAGIENRTSQPQPTVVGKQAEQPREKGQPASEVAGTATTSVDANTPAKATTNESQRTYSPEPTAGAPPPPPSQPKAAAGAVAADRPEDKEREQRTKDDAAGAKREDARGRERDETALAAEERAAARKVQTLPSNARNTQGLRKNETATVDKKARSSAATRSAGGRQFRREDNAWVDTAYDSSRPLVNVRRGSEQYRALIADEEGLRNIVEALDGTVIVVWKGRAYRFQ